MYQPLQERVPSEMPREDRVQHIVEYFCCFLCEDSGPDGTPFDCAVLDALRLVEQRFPEKRVAKA